MSEKIEHDESVKLQLRQHLVRRLIEIWQEVLEVCDDDEARQLLMSLQPAPFRQEMNEMFDGQAARMVSVCGIRLKQRPKACDPWPFSIDDNGNLTCRR
jgi:hypothetical protein